MIEEGDAIVAKPEKSDEKQPKQPSKNGKPPKASHLMCCGPDLLTVHTDVKDALSVLESPKQIKVVNMHLRQNPCVIVKGKKEELEKLKTYLVTRERYVYP
ncbi:MAG TPA: hypothetical protein VL354_01045 [Spirochaetia bacterium]|nr:hypothetical protein [Spirochaetia bacterium]